MATPKQEIELARETEAGLRVLVVEDDDKLRKVYATFLRAVDGVSSVVVAVDGLDAVEVARALTCHIAIVDLNVPRLDGVEAAVELRALDPASRIALHSSDPVALRARASGLGFQLFDKLEFEPLMEWVEQQAAGWRPTANISGGAPLAPFGPRLDLSCLLCGYGIVTRKPPARCPMCDAGAIWVVLPSAMAARERFAG